MRFRCILPIIYFLISTISGLETNKTNRHLTNRKTPHVVKDLTVAAQAPDGANVNAVYGDYDRSNYERGGGRAGQHSTKLAFKAAEDAKAATNAQAAAGLAASQQIKLHLAEKAFQAARAAEVALSDKQEMVERLEQEIQEADAVYQEESAGLQDNQQSVQYAMLTAQQAKELQKTLKLAVQVAQSTVGNSEQAASGAQAGYIEKTQLVEAARNRAEQLLRLLSSARADFAKTKQAAYNAACAAREAKANAERGRRQLGMRFTAPHRSPHVQEKKQATKTVAPPVHRSPHVSKPVTSVHKPAHVPNHGQGDKSLSPPTHVQKQRHANKALTLPHRWPNAEQHRHFDKQLSWHPPISHMQHKGHINRKHFF